jgi:GNAT superfamily N-acetyltransferase
LGGTNTLGGAVLLLGPHQEFAGTFIDPRGYGSGSHPMKRLDEILELYDQHRRTSEDVGCRREDLGEIVRSVALNDPMGCVTFSALTEYTVDASIEAQKEYFRNAGCRFEWKWFSHDQPTNLKERLEAHGFEMGDEETIDVLDLKQGRGEWPELSPASGGSIRKIADPDEWRHWSAVRDGVLGGKAADFLGALGRELAETPDRLSIYVVMDRDVPVSVGWLRLPPAGSGFASLWGGTTLPAYRGRGFYTALVGVRVNEARERGARFLTVDALPTSRPILERLGFRALTTSVPFTWPPSSTPSADRIFQRCFRTSLID